MGSKSEHGAKLTPAGLSALFLHPGIHARYWLNGRRFSAEPFSDWSAQCPVCGGNYDLHEYAGIAVAPLHREDFVEAIGQHDWARARAINEEHKTERMSRSDILLALVLRCPRNEHLCVFLARQTYELYARDPLIFHQVGNESAYRLLGHLSNEQPSAVRWNAVVFDQLERTLRFFSGRWQSATRWQKAGTILVHPVGLVLAAILLLFSVALVSGLMQ